jgi:DNA polymerase (family 10)
MAEAARALGHEYIAITDHSKALTMAFGLDEQRVVEFARTVRKLNESGAPGIRVFAGLECDILIDGAMDIAWDALAELDIVIGSVHSHMNLEPAAMTDRLLRALECPHLRVLGHPTGRRLLHRDPYLFDFDRVIAEAVKRGVWLEVNSSPERLDLSANHIRSAKAKGAKFVVNTDAHHPKHLQNLRYGVLTARRGGLTPDDILNTASAARFAEALTRSRNQ